MTIGWCWITSTSGRWHDTVWLRQKVVYVVSVKNIPKKLIETLRRTSANINSRQKIC